MKQRIPGISTFLLDGVPYARVILPTPDGKRRTISLGRAGPKAEERYRRVIAAWLADGRYIAPRPTHSLTVADLAEEYLVWAEGYYGKQGSETYKIRNAIRVLRPLAAHVAADEFDATMLDVVRKAMLHGETGDARGRVIDLDGKKHKARRPYTPETAAALTGRIVAMFRWAASRKRVPVAVYSGLQTLEPLRVTARKPRRQPANMEWVRATLPHLGEEAAALVRLQLLTGARPSELLGLRPCDLDMSGDVWIARLEQHKTAGHGARRSLYLNKAAQDAIRGVLSDDVAVTGRIFTTYGEPDAYRRHIARVCNAHSIPTWTPYQLRHTYCTAVEARFGADRAQLMLGHADAAITERYIARDDAWAIEIARQIELA